MNKYPLPIILPAGTQVIVSQPFGPTNIALEPEGPNGEPHFHYGVDLLWGTAPDTFGCELVIPAPVATLASYIQDPGSPTVTPCMTFNFTGSSGNKYQMVLAHVSKLIFATEYKEGQVVALTGNYGDLQPQPTFDYPYGGSHLHLGLTCNDKWVNPLDYFDINQYTVGLKRPIINLLPRAQWALNLISGASQG